MTFLFFWKLVFLDPDFIGFTLFFNIILLCEISYIYFFGMSLFCHQVDKMVIRLVDVLFRGVVIL